MSKRAHIIVVLLIVAVSIAYAIDDIYYWPSSTPVPSAKTVSVKVDTVVVSTPKIRVVNEQDTTVTIVVRK